MHLRGLSRFRHSTPHVPLVRPESLYLFAPANRFAVGRQEAFPQPRRPDDPTWYLVDRPRIAGRFAMVGDPGLFRIWRFRPDAPHDLRPGPMVGLWSCPSATVVEALSPSVAMPAWDDIVRLCARCRTLADEDVTRITTRLKKRGELPGPGDGPRSMMGFWVAWSVGYAARTVTGSSRAIVYRGHVPGQAMDEVVDPAWMSVEAAAGRLADRLADGTATLAADGGAFGTWAAAKPRARKAAQPTI